MYCPESFAENRPEILRALIQRYPLATLVSMGVNGLEANHIPLYLAPGEAPQPVLQGHVARANPLWQEVPVNAEVLVIFQGPQHYISPSWYATKAETGKVVPTWNYVVVHAYGPLQIRDDPAWIRQQMVALTAQQEQDFSLPWQVDDAPQDFTERLIQQVVGIEIPVSRWQGKWKVSQNQPLCNRDSVITHLEQHNQPVSGTMAEYIIGQQPQGRQKELTPMTITVGFLVFPGIQLLDLAGPYEIFSALPDGKVHLFWKTREPVACSAGMLLEPTTTLADGPQVDVLCIPGGVGINALLLDQEVQAWVQCQAISAQFVTSVCTGALLLGTAGLLTGRRATTHWRYHDLLAELGAIPVKERVVRDGNLISGGGVTAGIDFGLTLVAALRGQAAAEEIQLALEYAPEPPFQAGGPEDAPKDIGELVRRRTELLHAEHERMAGAWRKLPPGLYDKSQRHELRTPLVRELRQDDDPAYRSLWRDALQQHAQYFRTAVEDDVPTGIPTRGAKDSFTFGAFEKNALVGIVSLERDRGVKLRHKALLFRMFVAPEVAGHGIGKSLLQEVLARAQGIDDLRYIHLTVLERNQRARDLYRSLGFVDFALEPEAVRMDADYVGEVQMMRFLRR